MGDRPRIVDHHAAGALDELVTEAALARARLRGNQHDARSTGLRLAQDPLEQSELALAADEAREAAQTRALEAAPDLAWSPQLEHPHGGARALETLLTTVEEVEEARRESRGLLGHTDPARGRQLLHPGGEADHVPLRGVVHAQVVADSPDDDLARVEAHADREIEPALAPHVFGERPEVARQLERGRACALGVVLVGDRGAKQRHDAVAGVLVDGPLVPVDAVREDPKEAIEEAMPFLGIDALGELHRVHDVGEEDGDQLALALERTLGSEDLLDEMARRVGARLEGERRCREVRAAHVAELRASRVFVSTGRAVHWTPAHLSLIFVEVTPGPTTAVCAVVIPVMAAMLLGEQPGPRTLVGMGLAIVSIVLVSQERRSTAHGAHAATAPGLRSGLGLALLAGAAIGLFFFSLARTAIRSDRPAAIADTPHAAPVAAIAIAGGVIDMLANALFLLATHTGLLSVVVTPASLYPASTVLLALMVLGERLSGLQGAGIGCALIAVLLIVGR